MLDWFDKGVKTLVRTTVADPAGLRALFENPYPPGWNFGTWLWAVAFRGHAGPIEMKLAENFVLRVTPEPGTLE